MRTLIYPLTGEWTHFATLTALRIREEPRKSNTEAKFAITVVDVGPSSLVPNLKTASATLPNIVKKKSIPVSGTWVAGCRSFPHGCSKIQSLRLSQLDDVVVDVCLLRREIRDLADELIRKSSCSSL